MDSSNACVERTSHCEICFEDFTANGADSIALRQCSHAFSRNCWTAHLLVKMAAGSDQLKCAVSLDPMFKVYWTMVLELFVILYIVM